MREGYHSSAPLGDGMKHLEPLERGVLVVASALIRASIKRFSAFYAAKIEYRGTGPRRSCRHRLKSTTDVSRKAEPSRSFVVPISVVL